MPDDGVRVFTFKNSNYNKGIENIDGWFESNCS